MKKKIYTFKAFIKELQELCGDEEEARILKCDLEIVEQLKITTVKGTAQQLHDIVDVFRSYGALLAAQKELKAVLALLAAKKDCDA